MFVRTSKKSLYFVLACAVLVFLASSCRNEEISRVSADRMSGRVRAVILTGGHDYDEAAFFGPKARIAVAVGENSAERPINDRQNTRSFQHAGIMDQAADRMPLFPRHYCLTYF